MSRLSTLVAELAQFYGPLPPPPRDPFALFVWEVLSTHSTPQKRDAAMVALRRLPALTPDAMWKAPRGKLEPAVAMAGPYLEQRLRNLRAGVDLFRRQPGLPRVLRGPLVAARRALKPFPQLGETGAHRMLLFAADHAVMPVDARINRVCQRLGYGVGSGNFRRDVRSVQHALRAEIPEGDVEAHRRAFLYLSHHGGATCTEAEPHCTICPLEADCPEGKARTARQPG